MIGEENGRPLHDKTDFLLFLVGKGHVASDLRGHVRDFLYVGYYSNPK